MQVVSPEKVGWAVNTFDRYKSPGVNRIFPALLIEGLDHIIGVLVGILRECIVTGHTPLRWKKVRVLFITKPGKKSYSDFKEFRPISLTSFFLKTLERLVDKQVEKSTKSALHSVVNFIENKLLDKKVVAGAFIDIEGFLNCTFKRAISETCQDHQISIDLSEWIMGLLESRLL